MDRPNAVGWWECRRPGCGPEMAMSWWFDGAGLRVMPQSTFAFPVEDYTDFRRLVYADSNWAECAAEWLSRELPQMIKCNEEELADALKKWQSEIFAGKMPISVENLNQEF